MNDERIAEGRTNGNATIYKIYTIVDKPGSDKGIWLDIGVGRLNRDASITGKLDCIPINGVIQIRPHDGRNNKYSNNNSSNMRREGDSRS